MTGAEAVDDTTVDVISDSINPLVESAFSSFLGVVVMQKSWVEERDPSEVALDMNGTGPFVLESYEQDVSATMVRNEDYWGEPPAAASLSFTYAGESSTRVNQLLAGEADLTVNIPPADVPRVADSPESRIENVPSTRILHGCMRNTVEPFTSKEFRQAMNYAIDVEAVIEGTLSGFGIPTGQPTLPMMFGHNPDIDPYPYDPELAASLVEESGFAGVELEVIVPTGRYLKGQEFGQAYASYIDDLPNVSCEPNIMDFGTFVGRLGATGDDRMDFYIWGYGQPSFDASATIVPLLVEERLSTFESEELNELMAEANSIGDEAEREAVLHEANQLCHDEACWIFLHGQSSIYGVNNSFDWQPRTDELVYAGDIALQEGE
ncbi:MAG: ABC transporter substrate-binding protein [Halobacteriota archaeon]